MKDLLVPLCLIKAFPVVSIIGTSAQHPSQPIKQQQRRRCEKPLEPICLGDWVETVGAERSFKIINDSQEMEIL